VKLQIRFLSVEPLLDDLGPLLNLDGIHWVICGGESGPHLFDRDLRERRALVVHQRPNGIYRLLCPDQLSSDHRSPWVPRPDRIDWVRHVRDKCIAAGVAFFFKQWGGEHPESGGRMLDDRTWDEFPPK
jgi:protein gp37